MSRDVYGGRARGSGDRWDTERFEYERERNRFTDSRDRFDDRDSFGPRGGALGGSRYRQHSDDDFDRRHSPPRRYDDRGPARYEEDRYEKKVYYDDEPRFEREIPRRNRGESTNITIEKEREYFSPSPPRRAPIGRPTLLRRQSSLDTFDRKPLTRFSDREEYGPPARYRPEEPRLPPLVPIPLPRTRQLGPPPSRRYEEKDYYEEIRVAEPDYYGDEDFRGYPERIREREIVRSRRRSRSRSRSRDRQSRATRSVRSDSSSSRGTSVSGVTARSEFPKKGKTRMPARLVSKQAIIDLGYPFVEEGDVIIIQKALGRENIDEVIKLSEDYKKTENPPITETTLTTYVVGAEAPIISSGRSDAGGTTIIEEHKREEIHTVPVPAPPLPQWQTGPPPPPPQNLEVVTDTKIVTHRSPSPHHHHHSGAAPVIIDTSPGPVFHEHPPPPASGALIVTSRSTSRDERAILDEIRALEAEKEALRAERRADREMRKADRLRRGARHSDGDLVLYEQTDTYERIPTGDVTIVKKEYIEPEGGVKIIKDKKGRMAITVPKYLR